MIGRRTETPSLVAAAAIAVSAIAPFSLLDNTNTCSHVGRTDWSADGAGRGLAPEVFQPVVLACLGREDVHDHVPVVEQDPACLAGALGAARQEALVAALLQLLVDPVVDRL